MLTAELPQMSIKGKIQPILTKLSRLSGQTAEVLSGESVEIHTREAKISRMQKGVALFIGQWEQTPNKNKLLDSVSQAKRIFEAKQVQYGEGSLKGYKSSLEAEKDRLREELLKLEMVQCYTQDGDTKEKNARKATLAQLNAAYNETHEAIRTTKFKTPEEEFDAAQEAYQVALTGFLFAKNKELYKADKGSLDAYDSKKEARQIEGVLRAINETAGQHLHIGTGEGKSTVILPIASLVDAATNTDGKVVVGSANGVLVDELKKSTTRLAHELRTTNLFGDIDLHNVTTEGKSNNEGEEEDLSAQITQDVLLQGSISKETKEKQKSSYWKQYIQRSENDDLLSERADKKVHKIDLYFGDEKDLVFKWMDDPEAFVGKCPKIYMDEAHVAYDKGTPYSKTGQSEAIGEDDVRGGVSNWLIHYIVAQEIKETDVVPSGGGYILAEDTRTKLNTIQFHKINPQNKKSYAQSFYKGVDIILGTLGVDMQGQQKERFAQTLLTEMERSLRHGKERKTESEQRRRDHVQSIGDEIAKFVRLKDKIFTETAGHIVIRDAYIDELLSEHKYNPAAQSAVLAITGIFEPIKKEVAYKTATYPSFVHAIGDRFVALSGTLMHPNPEKKIMEKGSFASFLKTTTGCETCVITPPEMKPLPKPQLFEQTDEMYTALATDLKWEMGFDQESGYKDTHKGIRPTLLVDFNGLENATRTYKHMQAIYGEENVRLLLSKPTGGDKEAERRYVRQLNEYRSDLAQGKISMLVSSGSAALGVNFERPDGTFPDMRTVMIGMPDSEERVTQTIGRRRLGEGSTRNHLWYLSLSDLEIQESLLEKQTKRYYLSLERSQQQMHTALMKVKSDPDKVFSLIKTLMHKAKTSRAQDEEYSIRYDTIMNDEAIPYATSRLKRRIASELLGYDEETIKRITDPEHEPETLEDKTRQLTLDEYTRTFGLPSTIHEDAQRMSFTYALEQKKLFDVQTVVGQFEDQMRLLRQGIFDKTPASFNIDRYVDEWYKDSKKAVGDYMRLTNFALHARQLTEMQDERSRSAAFLPLAMKKEVYEESSLVSELRANNGLVFEIREVVSPTGERTRVICFTEEDTHFSLFEPISLGPIVAPAAAITRMDMRFIPVSLGISFGNQPPLPYFGLISVQ
ncbi:MAG: hypothetical protein V1922_05955 [bacterium]